jgi:hypothetical protein
VELRSVGWLLVFAVLRCWWQGRFPWRRARAGRRPGAIIRTILGIGDVNGVTLAQPEYFELKPAYGSQDVAELQYATKIVCYESGSFRGIPKEAFEHIAPVATVEFRFETFLVGPLEK